MPFEAHPSLHARNVKYLMQKCGKIAKWKDITKYLTHSLIIISDFRNYRCGMIFQSSKSSVTYIEPTDSSVLNTEIIVIPHYSVVAATTVLTLIFYILTAYENSQTQAQARQCSRPPALIR